MSVPIPPIGIHRLSDKDYFAIDLPSSSSTKVLASHPNATLAWERENPREESDDFAVGAYVHACLLDPESIPSNFIMSARSTSGRRRARPNGRASSAGRRGTALGC